MTQLFFDNECFYRFRELADKAGITVPITAGIMPFMGKSQISRMVFMCGASLPPPSSRFSPSTRRPREPAGSRCRLCCPSALRPQGARCQRSAPVHYEPSCNRRDHYGAPGVMEKPHADMTVVEVPADLASPALYRIDAAHHPRVDRAEMLRYLATAASRLSPSCRSVLSLSLNVWNWTLSPWRAPRICHRCHGRGRAGHALHPSGRHQR